MPGRLKESESNMNRHEGVFSECNYLKWYFKLPSIHKLVGTTSKYHGGTVRHIDFHGECTVVWVEYSRITKAYSYR